MDQFVRDARIAMIYEGANGIQALDLVGRKLGADGGRAVMAFFNEVQGFIKDNGDEAMKPYVTPLGEALGHLQRGHHVVHAECDRQAGQCRRRLARLHASLRAGCARLHVVAAWSRPRRPSSRPAPMARRGMAERMKTKLTTGRFFMERMLPETAAQLTRIQSGAGSMMELPAEAF